MNKEEKKNVWEFLVNIIDLILDAEEETILKSPDEDMCYRFALEWGVDLKKQFWPSKLEDFETSYNIVLGRDIPVVYSRKGRKRMQMMKRWLIPHRAKDISIGNKLWNARSETVFEKTSFMMPIKKNRCIIPASWFYEWKDIDWVKQPYYFSPTDEKYFWFAGIFDVCEKFWWKKYISVSILTTTPNKTVEEYHDRMPVILTPDMYKDRIDDWEKSEGEINNMMNVIDSSKLQVRPVSRRVNSVKYHNPDSILPYDWVPKKQIGLF